MADDFIDETLMPRFSVEGFSDKEIDYYSRLIMLSDMGVEAQNKLKGSTVCIAGLGGLGSPVAMQLASMGVGKLRLVDSDVVETSNLQRQHLYSVDQVGLPKVEAAAKRLMGLNPFIELEPIPLGVTPLNVAELIEGCDVVIGALDHMAPRYALNRACLASGTPFIHGAAVAYNGNVTTILPEKTACLECFQGGIDDSTLPTCAVIGVHPSLVNVIGSLMASETVRIIAGHEPALADKLMFVDFQDLSFDIIKLRRSEKCPVCGVSDKAPYGLEFEPVVEICGREGRRVFVYQPLERHDLELYKVIERVETEGYEVYAQGMLGFSFLGSGGVKGSVLKSGIVILEGFDDRESATKFHDHILG